MKSPAATSSAALLMKTDKVVPMRKIDKFLRSAVAVLAMCAVFGATSAADEALVADGAADARKDFAEGVLVLLGGRDTPPATYAIGDGELLEVVTDACALGPDPEGYIADYNRAMKALILETYGTDVDDLILRSSP